MSYEPQHTDEGPERAPIGILEVVLGIALLVIAVGAYLTLVLTGHEGSVDTLLAFLSPVVGAVFIVGAQQRSHARTTTRIKGVEAQVAQVVRQTNGVLDQRIKDRTTDALNEYPIEARVAPALAALLNEHLEDDGTTGP